MSLSAVERLVWIALLAVTGFAVRTYYHAQSDARKAAVMRSELNPDLKVRTEISSQGMREVADLPCGEHFVLWSLSR
jgi:hypothetical protein